MRFLIGAILFVGGVALFVSARRERDHVLPGMQRLGIGVAALGLASMTLTLGTFAWNIVSIVFGAIAVGLLLSVMISQLRRR